MSLKTLIEVLGMMVSFALADRKGVVDEDRAVVRSLVDEAMELRKEREMMRESMVDYRSTMAVILSEDLKDGWKEVYSTQMPYLGRNCTGAML